jgi:hypothetical protein
MSYGISATTSWIFIIVRFSTGKNKYFFNYKPNLILLLIKYYRTTARQSISGLETLFNPVNNSLKYNFRTKLPFQLMYNFVAA